MEVYLLKSRHKYDEHFEDIGIFTSVEKMEKAKQEFFSKSPFLRPEEEYEFTFAKMVVDELY